MVNPTSEPRGAAGQMAEPLQPLLAPFATSSLRLRNRFALAPMSRFKSPGGIPTDVDVDYYRRRAAGGAGLIITEGTHIGDPAAGFSSRVPDFFGEGAGAGWRRVVEAVHAEGSAIIPQLWHTGALRGTTSRHYVGVAPKSPSGIDLNSQRVGDPMTIAEIDEVVAAYAESARLARAWGFDGVELHGAHGYLLDEFLWARTNLRTDAYGRHSSGGTTFPVEVVRAVRDAVGPDFAVVYRFSQWKADNYKATIADSPAELASLLLPLADAGVNVFHPSTRRHWIAEFADTEQLSLAGWTKKITGLPVIAVGSVGIDVSFGGGHQPSEDSPFARIQTLAAQFERGDFDIIALGRAMLADAAWVNKMTSGNASAIRRYQRNPDSERVNRERTY